MHSLGVDADQIFNATLGQRSRIVQQLEEAERNARDALFTLETMELKLASQTAEIKSTLLHLSEILPRDEFEKMCGFAFGKSKMDWEGVWKHEWVDDSEEKARFAKRRRGPLKKPRRCSSPLPPSSPPPPTSPAGSQGGLPPCTGPIRTKGSPWDESQRRTHPRSPLSPDRPRAPRGFVDKLGSAAYRRQPAAGPSQPQQIRRLKRDDRLLEAHRDGTLVVVDPQEDIEAHRREIREKIGLQTQQRLLDGIESSLRKIVRTSGTNGDEDPPVTWSRVFGYAERPAEELVDRVSQDDPPVRCARDREQNEDEDEPDSESDPPARGDLQ